MGLRLERESLIVDIKCKWENYLNNCSKQEEVALRYINENETKMILKPPVLNEKKKQKRNEPKSVWNAKRDNFYSVRNVFDHKMLECRKRW